MSCHDTNAGQQSRPCASETTDLLDCLNSEKQSSVADECTPIKSSSRTISETVHAPVLSGDHLEMADSRCPASVHQNLLTSSSLKKTFEIDDGATDLRDIETLSILNLSGVGDEDSSCNEYLCFALHSSTIKHTAEIHKEEMAPSPLPSSDYVDCHA